MFDDSAALAGRTKGNMSGGFEVSLDCNSGERINKQDYSRRKNRIIGAG
jgi:hypothetical protein